MSSSITDFISNLQVIAEDGVTYQLYGGSPARFMALDGIGIPPVRRILQKSPLQHGATDKGFRLEPRRMTLTLYVDAENSVQADGFRDTLTHIFLPTNDPISLLITKKNGAVRKIDCYLDGQMDYPMSGRVGASHAVIIPLIAPEPAFYNPTQITTEVMMPSSPVEIAVSIASYTWDDWPYFRVTGPITGFQIDHTVGTTVVELLTLTGDIPVTQVWGFDFRPGYKTVERISIAGNELNHVVPTTIRAFTTMRVLSDKAAKAIDAAATSNRFIFTGSGLSAASKVQLLRYERYLSL